MFLHTQQLKNENEDKIVLFIELQAAIQVIIQHLSPHLDPDNPNQIDSITSIVEPIDQILNDVHTAGCGGHILLLVMHLLNRLGEEKLIFLFQHKFDTICRNITSLEHAKDMLKVRLKQGFSFVDLLFFGLAESCSLIKKPPICICFV